jgi:hypothetical protein
MLVGKVQGPVLFILKNKTITLGHSDKRSKRYAVLMKGQKKSAKDYLLRTVRSKKKTT